MLRDYRDSDAEAIVRVALAAFAEFEQHYSDWPLFTTNVAKMPQIGKAGEIIAEDEGAIVGAVAYVGPRQPKPAFFDPAWPVIRLLVVDPAGARQGHLTHGNISIIVHTTGTGTLRLKLDARTLEDSRAASECTHPAFKA